MMKNTVFYIGLLLSSAILISCEDLLVKDLDIEDDFDYEPQLVISATLANTSPDFPLVFVGENTSLIDPVDSIKYISDARVTLTKDNVQTEELILLSEDNGFYYLIDTMTFTPLVTLEDGEFRLDVEHGTLGTASAEVVMPEHIPLIDLDYDTIESGGNIFDDFAQYNVTLKFDDPAEKNYYKFSLKEQFLTDTLIFEGDSTIITSFVRADMQSMFGETTFIRNDGLYIDDGFFNGLETVFSLQMSVFGGINSDIDLEDLEFEWASISESEYLFKTSRERLRESGDFGLFQEPVTLYSNVDGGVGYLGALNGRIYMFE